MPAGPRSVNHRPGGHFIISLENGSSNPIFPYWWRGNRGPSWIIQERLVKPKDMPQMCYCAEMTYFGTNGTSTPNNIVFFGRVRKDEIVLVDRNCHKLAERALTVTHSVAIYMIPTRNRYSIIGPIPTDEMTPESIKTKIAAYPMSKTAKSRNRYTQSSPIQRMTVSVTMWHWQKIISERALTASILTKLVRVCSVQSNL